MPDAAYYRKWRAEHPEYRARQNALRNERRRLHGRESRARELANRSSRATPPLAALHTGHDLFELARQVVGPRRTGLTTLVDPLHEDLLSVAVVATLEGRDPIKAVAEYRRAELRWGRLTAPLMEQ